MLEMKKYFFYFYFLWIVISTLCSCKKSNEPEVPCNCNESEYCSDGKCICDLQTKAIIYGSCVPKSGKKPMIGLDAYKSYFSKCFNFDSTIIHINSFILNRDTGIGHFIQITKSYYFDNLKEDPSNLIRFPNARLYQDNNGFGLKFTLGADNSPSSFRPLDGFGDTAYSIEWDARLIESVIKPQTIQSIEAKVILLIDRNNDNKPEFPIDSCVFKFEKY